MPDIKEELHKLCTTYVQKRMDEAEKAFKAAEQASNDDTKSSAGDKYETGRAMMQQEKDRNTTQLNEANKLMVALNRISAKGSSAVAETGSLVITNNGKFYIAISAGTLAVNGESYFAVSPASPIGIKLKGLKVGDEFDLNGKEYKVVEVV
ncbi:3-oxoacyl-ACP synthase [Mucilaginibacter sp. X5P1]|uniref:3-oxoacyl-ACP synthase n=1 Tax=Mucilaginibacter sp. X5P1 TaxID=2723088 RepID=UPI001617A228|nr:3-oxoacyl-ACP synthase [Mucilaginibacter sp. X5P1]MBB6139467.1 transcription elongation GreA/GreB family factor [Mucilaginibacter sp. X5P1]